MLFHANISTKLTEGQTLFPLFIETILFTTLGHKNLITVNSVGFPTS